MPQFHQSSVVIERERGNENLGMSNCLPNESRNPQDGNDVDQFAHYRSRAVMLSTQVSQQVYAWLKQSAAVVATNREGHLAAGFSGEAKRVPTPARPRRLRMR